MRKILGVLTLLLALGAAASAGAAGSGWYLRGAVGYEWSLPTDFSDKDSAAPANYFGVGPGSDGRQIGAYGDFGRFPGVEAAVGRQLLPWLRAEFALTYRPEIKYRGQANFRGVPGDQSVSATADALSGTANLFLDIAGISGVSLGRFQPYVGGGVGLTHNWLHEMTYNFPGLAVHKLTITPSGERTDLALMATLGTGIVLSERVILDIAWRYTDLGRVYTDAGKAYLNNVPAGVDIDQTWAPLRFQGIFAGVRYLFR